MHQQYQNVLNRNKGKEGAYTQQAKAGEMANM